MEQKYKVDNKYLAQMGLDLNEYALDGTFIPAIINKGYGILINRMCQIGDQFNSEQKIVTYLENSDSERTSEEKISAFKDAQYNVIYNLVFQNETNPVDRYVDGILAFQLGCKINGFQKGIYYKTN